jgi:hypothetical protein
MPSPIAGMDFYLEGRRFSADLDDGLIFVMKEGLQARWPPAFYAGIS